MCCRKHILWSYKCTSTTPPKLLVRKKHLCEPRIRIRGYIDSIYDLLTRTNRTKNVKKLFTFWKVCIVWVTANALNKVFVGYVITIRHAGQVSGWNGNICADKCSKEERGNSGFVKMCHFFNVSLYCCLCVNVFT